MVMFVCEGALTSCPDFILGNYVLAVLIVVEYGIFLCSIAILDSLAVHDSTTKELLCICGF